MRFERSVKMLVKHEVSQCQFDALVSFAFNCGPANLEKSTLLKKVNAGLMQEAAQEFLKWEKGGGKVLLGLVKRRAAERALFLGEDLTKA